MKLIDASLVRFLLIGMGNTVLGLAVIFLLHLFLSEIQANFVAYLLVVPITFSTHRTWSFRDHGSRWQAFLRYLPVVLLGYGANLLLLKACLAWQLAPELAQVVATAAYVGTTYVLSRLFVFLRPDGRGLEAPCGSSGEL